MQDLENYISQLMILSCKLTTKYSNALHIILFKMKQYVFVCFYI
jgi:hypothetical protein